LNTTKEKGDGNKLPSLSSLQQHHRKRQQHIAIIFLFSNTQKNNKKKPREGRELTFKPSLYLFIFGSRFCLPVFALLFQMLSHGIFFF